MAVYVKDKFGSTKKKEDEVRLPLNANNLYVPPEDDMDDAEAEARAMAISESFDRKEQQKNNIPNEQQAQSAQIGPYVSLAAANQEVKDYNDQLMRLAEERASAGVNNAHDQVSEGSTPAVPNKQTYDFASRVDASNPWTGGQFGQQLAEAYAKINSRQPFSYDVRADALYQQYKNMYMRQGQMAMMNAAGQAQAMTGGYANTYAQSVGQQAYQDYLGRLNDIVPQLEANARARYNEEADADKERLSILNSLYNNEYGQYKDARDYALEKAQADARIRQYDSDVAYNEARAKALGQQSYQTSEYGEDGRIIPEDTSRTADFISSHFNDKLEFNHRKAGTEYASGYTLAQYLKAEMDKLAQQGLLTDAEIAYLIDYYQGKGINI